jgi:ABC-2 type transport system permease protein
VTAGSLPRIGAVVLRHWYLISGSLPRILDLCYWPLVQMILWGFIQTFMAMQSSYFAQGFGILLGAVMLWDILFRGQISLALSFFEEVYSRNLGHLLATPLRPAEYVVALALTSMLRTLIGILPATLLAIWFFGFSVYSLGLGLVVFFFSLIAFGWSIGFFVSGLVLRYGLGAEGFAWAVIFALAPLCGVYYPTSILPEWVQPISAALPPSYIFDGMRAILLDQTLRWDLLLLAAVLNVVWVAGGVMAFLSFYDAARDRGAILQLGE